MIRLQPKTGGFPQRAAGNGGPFVFGGHDGFEEDTQMAKKKLKKSKKLKKTMTLAGKVSMSDF